MTMLGLVILVIGMTPAFAELESPLQQYKAGIPIHEIQCTDSKILMESSDGKPACVNESSIERLQSIGYEMVSTTAIELKESLSVNENHSIEKSEQSVFEINPTEQIMELESNIETIPLVNSSTPPLTFDELVEIEHKKWEKIQLQIASGINTPKLSPKPSIPIYNSIASGELVEHMQQMQKLIPTDVDDIYTNGFGETISHSKESYAFTSYVVENTTIHLNPSNLREIIPQDSIFNSGPRDDSTRDEFALKLVRFLGGNVNLEKIERSGGISYETDYSILKVYRSNDDSVWHFSYYMYGPERLHPDKDQQITSDLLKFLGITLDGTERLRVGAYTSNFSFELMQMKNNVPIITNKVSTEFRSGYTNITFTGWDDNPSDLNLYDPVKAVKNGIEYVHKIKELTGPHCDIRFPAINSTDVQSLIVVYDRPIYDIYAGSCKVNYMHGHQHWYSVFVDAITGEPLYVQNRPVF